MARGSLEELRLDYNEDFLRQRDWLTERRGGKITSFFSFLLENPFAETRQPYQIWGGVPIQKGEASNNLMAEWQFI